jgi:formate dehydrogenase alpha subunit
MAKIKVRPLETITLTINGNKIICPKETSIFDAAVDNGIKIPNLCHHHSLKPFGACRMCLVEDQETGRLMASCVTPAMQDMNLVTDSPPVVKHRRNIVRLMMAEHPESCIVCNKGNRCKLRQIAAQLGIGESGLYPMPNYKTLEQANPFIIRDLSKCILCGKCIRADHEFVATGAIDYNMRGFKSRPSVVHDLALENSNCTFCGTCISICPTGALSPKLEYAGTPEKESVSICGFCGVGCNLKIGAVGEQVVEVNPAHNKKSVNDATLCVRGHFAHDFLNSPARLTQPMIMKEDQLEPASFDEAIETVSSRLLEILEKNGPQSIAFLGSSKCTNEENYLFQKIARVIFKTNNVDNGGYISGRHILSMIESRTDKEGRFNFFAGSLSGLEKADIVFVVGADPGNYAPVVNYYLKRGAKKGTPLIVAGSRQTDLMNHSSVGLHPAGGNSNDYNADLFYIGLINSLSAMLLEKEAYDKSFIGRFTKGFSNFKKSLSEIDIKQIVRDTGLDFEVLQKAVEMLKGKKIAFVIGHEILLHRYADQIMEALLNLALMTGSIGYEGAGFHVLGMENNLVGSWDMGTVPDLLPGRRLLENDPDLKEWELEWEVELLSEPGLNLFQMIQAAEDGRLKALYIMGENPIRSLPQSERVLKALENLDFIIVQDILESETSKIADVVLPGAAFTEKGGSFTNMEGIIQTFSPVVLPPGEARPDFEILGLLADRLGRPEFKGSPEKIREEIGQVIPTFLKNSGGRQSVWIKETNRKKENHVDIKEDPIKFSPVVFVEDKDKDNGFHDEFPITAFLGSLHFHLGSGTRTSQSSSISKLDIKGEVEISPDDIEKFNLKDGDRVKIVSRYGIVEKNICANRELFPGMVFLSLAINGNDAKDLIGLTELFTSGSESWNSCKIRIEKV